MGQRITSILQRNNENVQEVAIANSNAYRWPPKTGNYFGSHFIMGGERFDSQQPEAFLFGENSDLNFLGNRPMPFPYPAPQLNEPTRTLRSLVNIRKDTVRLVKVDPEPAEGAGAGGDATAPTLKTPPTAPVNTDSESDTDRDVEAGDNRPTEAVPDDSRYNIEFTFDSDVTCNITVMYFAKEEVVNGVAVYTPRDISLNSETYTYKRAANQVFTQSTHIIEPGKFSEEDWIYSVDKEEIPIVIQCTVDKEPDHAGHSHITFCVLEKLNDGYSIKTIKQKQCVDGLLYILQEFYGIENKENEHAKNDDEDDFEDNTAECVICMSDIRDTLILPCRHLCLCNGCANSLRYQANNCPICRAPFRALLQLRAIRKKVNKPESENNTQSDEDDDMGVSQKGVPQGYEAISLIEALNGPCFYNKSADPKQRLNSSYGSLRRSKKSKKKDSKGSRITLKDKNKDKDDIVDEEKNRTSETELQQTAPGGENTGDNTNVPSSDEAKTKEDTEADGVDQESKDTATDKATEETKTDEQKNLDAQDSADKNINEKQEDQSASKTSADESTKAKTPPSPTKSTGVPTPSKSQTSGDNVSVKSGDSNTSIDDTLALSAVSQTTTLPGTPDYVIDDDTEHQS